jgi:hypothetical protein
MVPDHDGAATASPVTVTGQQSATMRPTRVLLGWLADHEGMAHTLGRGPTPDDDLVAVTARIVSSQRAVRSRPPMTPASPIVDGDRELLDQAASRVDVQAAFAGTAWTVEWVDLRRIQPVQKFVYADGLDSLVMAAVRDPAELAGLCFPSPKPEPIEWHLDPDGRGYTFSSPNPNLVAGCLPPQMMLIGSVPNSLAQQVFGVPTAVSIHQGHLNVASYQGRYFLRDGTHRVAGLLHIGVTVVPAVVIEAHSWEFVAPLAGLIDRETALSEHAPLLTDFWDDAVSSDGLQPKMRTYWRFRPERFALPA